MQRSASPEPVVFAADAGSVAAGNFAWASSAPEFEVGRDLGSPADLVEAICAALDAPRPVAFGMEAPLSIPIAARTAELTRARPGEGNRPWSAGAGAGALATGLVELTWILEQVRHRHASVRATLSPAAFVLDGGLFIWEAFVSGGTKGGSHVADSRAAVDAFVAAWPDLRLHDMIADMRDGQPLPYLSLAGAALLRTGWTSDVAVLAARPAVLAARVEERRRAERIAG